MQLRAAELCLPAIDIAPTDCPCQLAPRPSLTGWPCPLPPLPPRPYPCLPADLEVAAKRFGIPFRHLPIAARDPASKAAQEAQIEAILQEEGIDVIVLARYMQVGLNGGQNGGLNGEQWWTDVGRAGGHGCGLWAVLAQTAEGVG